ncbi:MAG TPA: tetratricopeptide repeat protein [Polyangiaceae bacterium]|nr:tetratricopeptide repeat protein [Polyangiaceae bacterium]
MSFGPGLRRSLVHRAALLDWLPPSERVGLLFGWGALAALGFLPQLGGPGYDSALVAGIVLPSTAAVSVALGSLRLERSLAASLVHALHFGLVLVAGAATLTLLHGLRVGMCDPKEGFALYGLGPGVGALMGCATGALAAALAKRLRPNSRRVVAVLFALGGPLAGIALSLVRFYTSPMVFAYDPYFGYFSGPLYDTVIASLWPLASYRLGSLATLIALLAWSVALDARGNRGVFRTLLDRKNAALIGVGATVASLVVTVSGTELGHFSTAGSIERALGRRLTSGRCDVVYSSAVLENDARRIGRECHMHLAQVERFFDVSGPERVRVLLFANDAEKGRLMGAAHTYIAKPWRGEVYIQAAGYPHPVLGHELAHVVAGSFGRGPFKVAGLLSGLVPDPGRIEGVATAASPDENDALTLEEWAAAMQRLALLPKLDSLFRLTFFGHNAAQAYTAAGAFVRYLHGEFGAATVRRWYGGETLESVTQVSLGELEARWHAALKHISLSDAVLANARARFERPAFFARRCPRVIDRENAEANAHLAASDLTGAREGFHEVLRLDPHDASARIGLATCAARANDLQRAAVSFGKLSEARDMAPWARLSAQEARADVLLRQGQTEQAFDAYDALAQKLVDEDRLRTLDVKRLADEGLAREAIVALLLGDELGPSWDVAAPKLGQWSALAPGQGLADYLLGRNLYGRGRYHEAALALDRALGRKLPEPRVLDEALRLRLVLACALVDVDAARWALERLRARKLSAARREAVERLAERCSI